MRQVRASARALRASKQASEARQGKARRGEARRGEARQVNDKLGMALRRAYVRVIRKVLGIKNKNKNKKTDKEKKEKETCENERTNPSSKPSDIRTFPSPE